MTVLEHYSGDKTKKLGRISTRCGIMEIRERTLPPLGKSVPRIKEGIYN